MTRRSEQVTAEPCVALGAPGATFESYPNRDISLGSLTVARALPIKEKRLVGPWCFLDRFGPLTFSDGRPMDVAPHPHIGLQTVTWLLDGEVAHDDSLGSQSVLRPGGVNVMTAGGGIAHAERTPPDNSGRLDGVQLWVALPDRDRHMAAGFSHLAEVARLEQPGGRVEVFAGEMLGARSLAPYYSAILGADLWVHRKGRVDLPLDPGFEHALLVLRGDAALEGQPLDPHVLHYLGTTRTDAAISSSDGARVLLIGGPPFPEQILMWWNFVARTPEEIAEARAAWESQQHFGEVRAYDGPRLTAPPLSRLARPNALS